MGIMRLAAGVYQCSSELEVLDQVKILAFKSF
jgi:hypothetical protein